MLSAFANIVKIKDLRTKVLITLALLFVARLGVFIPIPGIDSVAIADMMDKLEGTKGTAARLMGMAAIFTGGSMRTGGIFFLGIMPYISSSIIMQLLTAVWPRLQSLAREGESGRKKINQYTRLLTVGICIVQGAMVSTAIMNPQGLGASGEHPLVLEQYKSLFPLFAIVSITVGTLFLMWLGEQIDEFGIGNGVSLIITIGIISQFPAALIEVWNKARPDLSAGMDGNLGPDRLLLLISLFFGMVVAVVALTQAQRRIPMSNMRRSREAFSSRNYLPLQVNMAGLIAIIFAQSIMMLPGFIHGYASRSMPWLAQNFLIYFTMWHFWYVMLYMLLIVFFCYFYTAITFNPNEQAENFQSHGLFIPGLRPGRPTAEYLEYVMNRITLFGAAAVSVVAVTPQIITSWLDVSTNVGQFFGGTGLLIIVGVALDVVRRIQAHEMMQYYDGFLARGRIRGRGR
jgi:preprotein translocase subunit SecY